MVLEEVVDVDVEGGRVGGGVEDGGLVILDPG